MSLRETMQWSVEPRLPCPPWVFLSFFFLLLSLNIKREIPKGFGKQLKTGFPIIFLKRVVPSLNRTTITTANNNNNNNN